MDTVLRSLEMNVTVNGKPCDVPDDATIAMLVDTLGFGERRVVVEHNGEPVERKRFALVRLSTDDVVEIVRAVQGG
jgi:thiamine biosynthesis protein ThiS